MLTFLLMALLELGEDRAFRRLRLVTNRLQEAGLRLLGGLLPAEATGVGCALGLVKRGFVAFVGDKARHARAWRRGFFEGKGLERRAQPADARRARPAVEVQFVEREGL